MRSIILTLLLTSVPATAAGEPLSAVESRGSAECGEFVFDVYLPGALEEFSLACSAPADAVSGFPGAIAEASATQKPVLGIRGSARLLGPSDNDRHYAGAVSYFTYHYRIDVVQPLPFDPVYIPMLWVTAGTAEAQGETYFFASSQFLNEVGTTVATYLQEDQLSFRLLRPYRWFAGGEINLDFLSECYIQGRPDLAPSCEFAVDAFPVFDQAAFDAEYGADSFVLADYYTMRFSDGVEVTPDMDEDAILDGRDNCTFVANPAQRDADGDGFGNLCDADFNNDCEVNVVDLGLLRAGFFSDDPTLDLNGDGAVNAVDLGLLRTMFLRPPGPSAATVDCREQN